jgi:hypothetical protein
MAEMTGREQKEEALLQELWQFPLLRAIFGRRARRFALGMEIPEGALAYRSRHQPLPLTELEQAVLIAAATGVTGWNFGIPYTPTTGGVANYPVRLGGRTFPTGAGVGSAELFYTDDEGTYLVRTRDLAPARQREVEEAGDVERLLEGCRRATVKLSDQRLHLPREYPHIFEHNRWNANFPGSTLFIPVFDMSEYFLSVLAIVVQQGQVLLDDYAGNVPAGDLGPFLRSGLLQERRRALLSLVEQEVVTSAATSLAVMGHNIVLVLQAMGLGGWMYTGINPYSILGLYAERGVPGLGFRFLRDPRWPLPNPVGLDGLLEGLCPPYHPDMAAAVAELARRKFGPGGAFDPETPGPFRDNAAVKGSVARYSPELQACIVEMARYVYETYGRIPPRSPTWLVSVLVQAQHIDTEFYDTYFQAGAYLETHARHLERWHAAVPQPLAAGEVGVR